MSFSCLINMQWFCYTCTLCLCSISWGWGGVVGWVHMSLVWISNIVVSCFEEWAMSLLLFNPSSCHLSPFHLVLCGCFTSMSFVGNFTLLTGPHKHLSRCKIINSMQLVEIEDRLSNLMMFKNILLLLLQRMMESCKVVLAYECVNEILWCIHSNETSHL